MTSTSTTATSTTSATTAADADEQGLFARFDAYDFRTEDFEAVVTPLLNKLELAGALPADQREAVLLRAKVQYYSRTIEPLSLDAYKAHLARSQPETEQLRVPHAPPARSLLPTLAAAATEDDAKDGPRAPQGFAQIGALIAAGRGGELVGVDVDDVTIHPEADAAMRGPINSTPAALKPWERASAAQEA